MTIAVIGGTGPEGRGLALRWAMGGEHVIIGSRDAARAEAAAKELLAVRGGVNITGADNATAAAKADIVCISVPYDGHKSTIEGLKAQLDGKLILDVVAPLVFEGGRPRVVRVPEGSAAQQAQKIVPSAKVVAAFQNLSAEELLIPDKALECDVIVCGDDREAKGKIMALAQKVKGVRAVDGGQLDYASIVEDLTTLILRINRIYKAHASIKFVGF